VKKLVMGFDVFNIYETEYWAEFVRLFWPLAIGFIILVMLILSILNGDKR
jgi:hypothetical protein